MTDSTEINWGYNCLTAGIHHGRPEALWNLPLFQAAYMFPKEELQAIVINRIFNDAMQFVENGVGQDYGPQFDKAWAEKVRDLATESYMRTLKMKIGEISKYYQSPGFTADVENVVDLIKENRLNVFYEPLHGHDTINMLCRILGTSASRAAS